MIQLNTSLIGSHIIRVRARGQAECLILHRSDSTKYYPGTWQILTGHVPEDETSVQAVLREIQEETRLKPLIIYSMNYVSRFFETVDESIYLVPLFLTIVPFSARVILNPKEHDQYKWCTFQQAQRHLLWQQYRKSLIHVQREFIERDPIQWLKVFEKPQDTKKKSVSLDK
jgi:dATP pyrophosphohydrolase